jgi:putative ABC transport system permease protein
MKLRRRISTALRALTVYRLRSSLAVTAVAVGVAAVIVARAVGDGARQQVARAVETIGTNLLVVKPLQVKRPVYRPGFTGLATTLGTEDCNAVESLPGIAALAPALEGKVRVKCGRLFMKAIVRGTTPSFLAVRNFAVGAGRFFDESEMKQSQRVVVIGARVNRELGQGRSLVGEEILLGSVPFEVIGVLREKGTTPDGANEDDYLLVPLPTAARRLFNQHWLTAAYVSVDNSDQMDGAEGRINETLRQRHGVSADGEDFSVQNTAKVRAFQQEITASMSGYATWLAMIALVVGGFGLMALTYISVRERTGEIGLRIAVGAGPRDILLHFLIEAGALCLAGWLLGCILAAIASWVISAGSSLSLAVPLSAVLMSLATAVVIGLGFGALPAKAAANIPPIQALLKK